MQKDRLVCCLAMKINAGILIQCVYTNGCGEYEKHVGGWVEGETLCVGLFPVPELTAAAELGWAGALWAGEVH